MRFSVLSLSEDMKRVIQLLAIGAACITGRGQTTNQLSTNVVAAAQAAATNNSEIAELRAEVAALKRQIEVLTVALQQAQQAQPAVPLQWHRTPTGGWFLGSPVSGASPSQNGAQSDARVAAIVRNAPGRVVGITVAPPRLGVPSFAHIASDGSVYYSLAPARGNF